MTRRARAVTTRIPQPSFTSRQRRTPFTAIASTRGRTADVDVEIAVNRTHVVTMFCGQVDDDIVISRRRQRCRVAHIPDLDERWVGDVWRQITMQMS